MYKPHWTVTAIVVLALGTLGVILAEEPQLNPQNGVLVLRSGRVLSGGIVPHGDRYIVTLGLRDSQECLANRINTSRSSFVG